MKEKNLLTSQVYPGTWLDKTEKPLLECLSYISFCVFFSDNVVRLFNDKTGVTNMSHILSKQKLYKKICWEVGVESQCILLLDVLMIICTKNPLPVGGFLAYFHR